MSNRYITLSDGAVAYVTEDGDMVDQIARRYYGEHKDKAELLYSANRGLADQDIHLPAGLVIRLPAVTQEETPTSFKRLWD
ncbi:phage tail protein X [Peteryoungia aggregata LMG 23059]|uniref:Phage tail protein X n=1 Tax=Peteryoungia aggregata LMG 23059 TaxID=1368425 RepID=A0ABU0GA96_9HYPH|nr:tail protein X [Peteryoungia aggregata]MDQ0422276.1 phage tail protein X [Peteryoungia aggregata LMG 23059]